MVLMFYDQLAAVSSENISSFATHHHLGRSTHNTTLVLGATEGVHNSIRCIGLHLYNELQLIASILFRLRSMCSCMHNFSCLT